MAAVAPAPFKTSNPASDSVPDTPLPDAIWRADQLGSYRSSPAASGYPELDRELPGGGWPPSVLVELLLPQPGIGELRLLAPVLAPLTQAGKTVLLLAPPHIPFAPALRQLGLDLGNVLVVQADKPADRVWAAQQALKSASLGALLCWLPQVKAEHLRRLQLAAAGGAGLAFVFRPWSAQEQSSPAPLRLRCQAAPSGKLALEVFKRRGPAHGAAIVVPLPIPAVLIKPFMARAAAVPTSTISDFPSHAVDRDSLAAIAARRRSALAL